MTKTEVTVSDGKYTFIIEQDANSVRAYCLRYGEEWLDINFAMMQGGKAFMALIYELEEAQEKIKAQDLKTHWLERDLAAVREERDELEAARAPKPKKPENQPCESCGAEEGTFRENGFARCNSCGYPGK